MADSNVQGNGAPGTSLEEIARQRVPSPSSALIEGSGGTWLEPWASSEGIRLQFTEVRTSGDQAGAYAGCEAEDWFELYNAGAYDTDYTVLKFDYEPYKCLKAFACVHLRANETVRVTLSE